MRQGKLLSLWLIVVVLTVILGGCSFADVSSTTDQSESSQVESSRDQESSASEEESESKSDEDASEASKADEQSSSTTDAASESSQSSASQSRAEKTSSSAVSSAKHTEQAGAATAQSQAGSNSRHAQSVPDNKVSTVGDSRVWGDARKKIYYTPAQNYRGYRPRNAVPFANEAAAKAAGYVQSSRRPR